MATHFFGITTREITYSHTVGQLELAGPGFFNPVDVAIGSGGVLYVPSRSIEVLPNCLRMTMCNIDEEYLGEFGFYGQGDGEFIWPSSVATDSQGNVYVADEWLQRISVFDKDGNYIDKWGVAGSGDGQLDRPSGLVFDKEDNLYLVDSANHRVQVFTKEGKFLHQFGGAGSGDGQFNNPWGITIDSKGDVYVADWRNDRIQKFTAGGGFLERFGTAGSGIGQFHRPSGVAVDRDGDIYVADWGNHRVQVFTPEWRHITVFTGDSTFSKWGNNKMYANQDMIKQMKLAAVRDLEPWRRFWHPVAIALDDQGRIIVVDCCRHRLQVYQKETASVL